MNKKNIVLLVLLFCVLGRLAVSPLPIDESLTTAADQGAYLHFSWFISNHPSEAWDYYWYGGLPHLRFYQPAVFYIEALLSSLVSNIIAFKLILLFSFILAPIAFYYLLKEFRLSEKERLVSTVIFSFAFYFNAALYFGKTPALSAVVFGLIFLKFFIRSIKNRNNTDILVSSVFLAMGLLTHSLTALMSIGLSLVYLASLACIKLDLGKVARGILVYVSGFMLSAYWLIPSILERGYSNFSFPIQQKLLNTLPFTGILRTFGFQVNMLTILVAAIATILICFGVYREYRAYGKRRNAESLFWMASAALFVLGYFIFYFFDAPPFPVESAIILWPVFLSVLIAKSMDRKILACLTAAFIILQLVLFFGVPVEMQSKAQYSQFDDAFKYLQDKEGRISFQPYAPYHLATVVDYRPALFGKESEFGLFPTGLPENRLKHIYGNLGFDCISEQSTMERVLSTDFFSRYYIKNGTCQLSSPDLEGYFYSMNVHYVIVDKQFPEVDEYFGANGLYKKVYEKEAFSIYQFLEEPKYVQISQSGISSDYTKLPDKIVITLNSDARYENVPVKISESWYPHWQSGDVIDIQSDESDGSMLFTVPEINGEKTITLAYNQPEYYAYLPILTFVWLGALAVYARKGEAE